MRICGRRRLRSDPAATGGPRNVHAITMSSLTYMFSRPGPYSLAPSVSGKRPAGIGWNQPADRPARVGDTYLPLPTERDEHPKSSRAAETARAGARTTTRSTCLKVSDAPVAGGCTPGISACSQNIVSRPANSDCSTRSRCPKSGEAPRPPTCSSLRAAGSISSTKWRSQKGVPHLAGPRLERRRADEGAEDCEVITATLAAIEVELNKLCERLREQEVSGAAEEGA